MTDKFIPSLTKYWKSYYLKRYHNSWVVGELLPMFGEIAVSAGK